MHFNLISFYRSQIKNIIGCRRNEAFIPHYHSDLCPVVLPVDGNMLNNISKPGGEFITR